MYSLLNFLRFLAYFIDFALVTVLMLVLSLLPKSVISKFYPALYKNWSLKFFRLFAVKERIHEKFNHSLPGHYILISNHPSGMELLWLPSRFKVTPLAKEEIKDWFIIGRITQAAGIIFVKRKDKESGHAASEALLDAIHHGKNVLIFPEGGCYGKDLNPFFMGAFHLSKLTGVPIIPVYLHYEEENTYEWGDFGLIRFMIRALFLPKNRNAHMYIFEPFLPSDYKDEVLFQDEVYKFYREIERKVKLK